MKKSIIILCFILAGSKLGNVCQAFDNDLASTRNYGVSNSDENPIINNQEADGHRKKKTVVLLMPIRDSEEDNDSREQESEENEEQLHPAHKTKRCKAPNPLRKTRRIPVPKDQQRYFSTESSIVDSTENPYAAQSYFRLASKKDAKHILKSLLKARSAKRDDDDDDPLVESIAIQPNSDALTIVGHDLKKSTNQRPKKYVCYCIEDNCGSKKLKKPSRPYALRRPAHKPPNNLQCPPGAVLVEESDYSQRPGWKKRGQKRRPVKKCPPGMMPSESEVSPLEQPMRINIPLAGYRKVPGKIYKLDRKSPFAQKLQSVIRQNEACDAAPYAESETASNGGPALQDYYNNQQSNFNPYAQVPIAPNLVYPDPYVVYPPYPQYPQYADGLVGEPQIPVQAAGPPCEEHREPSYEATPLARNFVNIEECIKMFGPNFCIVSTTTVSSADLPEEDGYYEEDDLEHPHVGSQWGEDIWPTTTESPLRQTSEWEYSTNAYNADKVATTYFGGPQANKEDEEDDEDFQNSSQYFQQSRITTEPDPYRGSNAPHYSRKPINKKIRPSDNFQRVTTSSYGLVGARPKKPSNIDDRENFVDSKPPIHRGDPNKAEYLIPIANSGEPETDDYYDVSEETQDNEIPGTTSLQSVTELPRLASSGFSSNWQGAHRHSSSQYREYTIRPTEKVTGSDSSEDSSEEVADFARNNNVPELPNLGTSEIRYSTNSFHEQEDRQGNEFAKYHVTSPSERVGMTEKQTTQESLNNYQKSYESSTNSPKTVFAKMEESGNDYRTTISTQNSEINRLQNSRRITTVYPIMDGEEDTVATSSRTQIVGNPYDEDSVSPSSNLYYSTEPERPTANRQPVDNYSKSRYPVNVAAGSNNRYTTSYATVKNAESSATPLIGINEPEQGKFTSTSSYPSTSYSENSKTASSWSQQNAENFGKTATTPFYIARSELPNVDEYSATKKSSHPVFDSQQSTNVERTTEMYRQQFLGSNEPTTENVISTNKHTDYVGKSAGSRDRYPTSYAENSLSENIAGARGYSIDSTEPEPEEITNRYGGVTSRNWHYTTQPGRKTTSYVNQQATTERSAQRHFVGTHQSSTTNELQESRKNPSEMSTNDQGFYSTQSDRPFFIATNIDTTSQSNLGETMTAGIEAEEHYTDDDEEQNAVGDSLQSTGTTLSFEDDSDIKEESKTYLTSQAHDDEVEEVTGPDSYFEGSGLKKLSDFSSISSDDSTNADDNEKTEEINYSTVVDAEVARMDRPKATESTSFNDSEDSTTIHDIAVEESTPKGITADDKFEAETQSYRNNNIPPANPTEQTSNEDTQLSDLTKNYGENFVTTRTQELNDDTRIAEEERLGSPHDASYSSTPMSAIHDFGSPSTSLDIFKSENIVRDEYSTEEESDDHPTTIQDSQRTLETDAQNLEEVDRELDDDNVDNDLASKDHHMSTVFGQQKFTTQRNIVSNTSPATSTFVSEDSSESNSSEEDLITVDDNSNSISDGTYRTTPFDVVGKTQEDENSSTNIEGATPSTDNEFQSDEYTNYDLSLENSLTTESSSEEPKSSSTVLGNSLRSQSFEDSGGVAASTLSYEDSTTVKNYSTSKNKESVGIPFSTVKSASKSYEESHASSSTKQIALQPNYTGYETTPINESTEEIAKVNELSTDDQKVLRTAVEKVVKDLISPNLTDAPNFGAKTPETVGGPISRLLPGLPILRNLFSLPEIKDMAISTVKNLISDVSGVPRDSPLGRLGNHGIESVLHKVVNDLMPGEDTTTSSRDVEEHRYENGHWTVVPATFAPSEDNVGQPAAKISKCIENIIGSPGIGLRGARFPAVQNVIVRAVENALAKAKDVVDNSEIWNTLNDVITRAENVAKSTNNSPFIKAEPLPKSPGIKTAGNAPKIIPIVPITERVFKNGQWSEVRTILGNKQKQHFEPNVSTSATITTARSDNGIGASTSSEESSISNAGQREFTTNAVDSALLEESEEDNSENDVAESTEDVPLETTVETVGATSIDRRTQAKADFEKSPIEYYSPGDRILTYIKNHQTPAGETQTTLRSRLETDKTTGYDRASLGVTSDEFSTVDDSLELEDVTESNSLSEESSFGSTEKSKICKCMDEERKNNDDQVRSSLQSSTQESTSVASESEEENESDSPSTIYHMDINNGNDIEYSTEEYIGAKNPATTQNSSEESERENSATESSEHLSTIHHLDVTESNDYSDEEYVSKETLSTTEESTEESVEKVGRTEFPALQSTANESDEEEEDNEEDDETTEEYVEQANSATTEISQINSKTIKSSTTESVGSNASADRNADEEFSTADVGKTTIYGEDRVGITSSEESTTLAHKFTKLPTRYESTKEATTLSRGLVGAAKSRGECQDLQENLKGSSNFVTPKWDPTYFGKISVNGVNPGGDKISDLANTDLFYVGDGVKIPLTIRRTPDGSYALSISEKICENFIKRKCPCCVPKEGEVVEERRQPSESEDLDYAETTSRSNSDDSTSFETTESSEYASKSKKRYVRSTSGSDVVVASASPVKSFAKKYNLTLNLEQDRLLGESSLTAKETIEEAKNTRRTKRLGSSRDTKLSNLFDSNNQIQRDDSEEEKRLIDDNSEINSKESNTIRRSDVNNAGETNSFIRSLMQIGDVPEHERAEVVVNALDGLINSASATNLSPIGLQSVVESVDDDPKDDPSPSEDSAEYDLDEMENEMARYGYQRDNPILERIRFLKEKQHGHGHGHYKYQKNIDHLTRGKMNVLKTVLHWLREVFLEAKVDNKEV